MRHRGRRMSEILPRRHPSAFGSSLSSSLRPRASPRLHCRLPELETKISAGRRRGCRRGSSRGSFRGFMPRDRPAASPTRRSCPKLAGPWTPRCPADAPLPFPFPRGSAGRISIWPQRIARLPEPKRGWRPVLRRSSLGGVITETRPRQTRNPCVGGRGWTRHISRSGGTLPGCCVALKRDVSAGRRRNRQHKQGPVWAGSA